MLHASVELGLVRAVNFKMTRPHRCDAGQNVEPPSPIDQLPFTSNGQHIVLRVTPMIKNPRGKICLWTRA